MPNSEKDDPMRAKLLSDTDEPRHRKSKTEIEAPSRDKLLTDKDDPS
jgi:hypothetical protein